MYRDVMLRIGWLAVLLIAACGPQDDTAKRRGTATAPVPRDGAASVNAGATGAPVITTAHGAQITLVAVADGGEVALSIDERGGARFWPALDGTREPVVVRGMAASDLAIARDGDGWRAALIDNAGGLAVLRLDRGGAVRDRALIAAEPGFAELAGGRELLLARRVDHVIVRLDVMGLQPLSSEHGDQVLAVAARRSFAIAGIADREHPGEIATVRRIELGAQLGWGPPIQLPVSLLAPIVISPDGRRLAGVSARTRAGVVIVLADGRVLASDVVGSNDSERALGFLDAERVAFGGGVVLGASPVVVADPWAGTRSTLRVRVGPGAAVADGVVASGFGTHLVLADPERNRFLGYRDVGVGSLQTAGGHVNFAMGDRLLWLDDRLQMRRALSLTGSNALHVIDDHRVLKGTVITHPGGAAELQLGILDATTGIEAVVGSWTAGVTIAYEPTTRIIAGFMQGKLTQRARLDALDAPMTLLRPLRTRSTLVGIELADPAAADGVIAVAHTSEDDGGVRLETFTEDPRGAGPIAPATTVTLRQVAMLGIDRTGVAYVLSYGPTTPGRSVTGWRRGPQARELAVDSTVVSGTVEPRGTALAFQTQTEVFAVGLDGAEHWRVPAWRVNALRYSLDGATLYVTTQGGLLALDAATGQRRATGCAWSFGMSTLEPSAAAFTEPIVCAEGE